MGIKEILYSSGTIIGESVHQALEDYCIEQCAAAQREQKENDIIASIAALSEAGVKEDALYDYLAEYWQIDSRRAAKQYIIDGRYFWWPLLKVKKYIRESNLSESDKMAFMREYNVSNTIRENPSWCTFSGEKIIAQLKNKTGRK